LHTAGGWRQTAATAIGVYMVLGAFAAFVL